MSRTTPRRRSIVAVTVLGLVMATGCGEDATGLRSEGAPTGDPLLPNLVPAPPTIIHMQRETDGQWAMLFTSVLVNTGAGDFALSGARQGDGDWLISQHIEYSTSGAEVVPTDARVVWGGDGHEHWHIERVATYRLEPLDADGQARPELMSLPDAKVGFCFFDSDKRLDRGADEGYYESHGCGHEDDEMLTMGLSPGWGDTYGFRLPGQRIDISDLPDGLYRLWAEADARGWFTESATDDNLTWVDIELGTIQEGLRVAEVVDVGPEPA